MAPKLSHETLYAKALRVITLRAGDGMTVKELCGVLHVSPKTLQRHFLDIVGRTPSQELIRLRMERAKELLANTKFSIKFIAILTGYRRVSYFGDFFRRQTGLSPRAYRQQHALPDMPAAASRKPQPLSGTAQRNIMYPSRKVRTECVC
jgi:AraC-like DNA-binding protein